MLSHLIGLQRVLTCFLEQLLLRDCKLLYLIYNLSISKWCHRTHCAFTILCLFDWDALWITLWCFSIIFNRNFLQTQLASWLPSGLCSISLFWAGLASWIEVRGHFCLLCLARDVGSSYFIWASLWAWAHLGSHILFLTWAVGSVYYISLYLPGLGCGLIFCFCLRLFLLNE